MGVPRVLLAGLGTAMAVFVPAATVVTMIEVIVGQALSRRRPATEGAEQPFYRRYRHHSGRDSGAYHGFCPFPVSVTLLPVELAVEQGPRAIVKTCG